MYQLVVLKAVVIKDNKILLGKRLKGNDVGMFEVPGGKLEVGENLVQGLKREVLEETGVDIDPVNVTELEGFPVLVSQGRRGKPGEIIFIHFLAKVKSDAGIVSETDELAEIGFYNKDEVKKILGNNGIRPAEVKLLEMFVEGKIEEK